MTPSVALRALAEQLHAYDSMLDSGRRIDIKLHFRGPVLPPQPGRQLPVGDRVLDAIAEYASTVVARAGLLTPARPASDLEDHGRFTRIIRSCEHALAIDLGRTMPQLSLRDREDTAKAAFALAAYWCDRRQLVGMGTLAAHPLLGCCPDDQIGAALWEHACAALRRKKRNACPSSSMAAS